MRHIYPIVVLLTLVVPLARAAEKATAPDFSRYTHTDSFTGFVWMQTNATWHLQHSRNLLAVSAFHKDDGTALRYFVNETGQEWDTRCVYGVANQVARKKKLSEANLKSLRWAISELPAENSFPPVERLVVVSFREGTNWVTRSYDSGTLPKAMRQIYDIIGERPETKKHR